MRRLRKPRSSLHRLILFSIGLLAIYGGYYWGTQYAPPQPSYQAFRPLQPPRQIAPFSLIDQNGLPFTQVHLRFHWSLLFFGYTADSDASRNLLQLTSQVLNRLADRPDLQKNSRVLFVTADPEQDSAVLLKQYMNGYGSSFLALTGEPEEISALARSVGATIKRQALADGYRIDHSTSIGLIDPQGRLAGLFTGRVDAVSIANDLKRIADTANP